MLGRDFKKNNDMRKRDILTWKYIALFILFAFVPIKNAYSLSISQVSNRFVNGDYRGAVHYSRSILQGSISSSEKLQAQVYLAKSYYYLWDLDRSMAEFNKISTLNPSAAEKAIMYEWVGDIYFMKKSYANAISSYANALTLSSSNAIQQGKLLYQTAVCYYELKDILSCSNYCSRLKQAGSTNYYHQALLLEARLRK